jgi:hypothetical protein
MSDKFSPLVIEDAKGRQHFVNCYEVFFIEYDVMPNVSSVNLAQGKFFFVTNAVAKILQDRLTDELFYSAISIEQEKAILNQPEE